MDEFIVISDKHSNHGLPHGARVYRVMDAELEPWQRNNGEWYTQGSFGDEVAIDMRDLEEVP